MAMGGGRVTRSATARREASLVPPMDREPRRDRKPDAAKRKADESGEPKGRAKRGRPKKSGADAKEEAKETSDEPIEKAKAKGKTKKPVGTPKKKITTLIIEAGKENVLIRRKSGELKDCLESAHPDITVKLNPERPRAGYFEVRDADGEIIFSLPKMELPYKELDELDLDDVLKIVDEKLKE